jgi:hypothetical protein
MKTFWFIDEFVKNFAGVSFFLTHPVYVEINEALTFEQIRGNSR